MDQWVRAPPHGFSQLATSFLACPRLGILRAPLLRLASVHGKHARTRNTYTAYLQIAPPNLVTAHSLKHAASSCLCSQDLIRTSPNVSNRQDSASRQFLALDNRHATRSLKGPHDRSLNRARSKSKELLTLYSIGKSRALYPNPDFQSSIRVVLLPRLPVLVSYYFVRPEPLKITKSAPSSTPCKEQDYRFDR